MEKILVVEDDKNIAQLEIDYLNSSGYETSWISDGAKACVLKTRLVNFFTVLLWFIFSDVLIKNLVSISV